MNNWESPLKKKKAEKPPPPPPTRAEVKEKIDKMFKKPKQVFSSALAKKVLTSSSADSFVCDWLERWVKNWVDGNSYPPQLVSSNFLSLLKTYFSPQQAEMTLARLRAEFRQYFPDLSEVPDEDSSPHIVIQRMPPDHNTQTHTDDCTDDSSSMEALCEAVRPSLQLQFPHLKFE